MAMSVLQSSVNSTGLPEQCLKTVLTEFLDYSSNMIFGMFDKFLNSRHFIALIQSKHNFENVGLQHDLHCVEGTALDTISLTILKEF